MISKYEVVGWTFFAVGAASGLIHGGVRGDVNFFGYAIIGSAFLLSEWIVEDLKK